MERISVECIALMNAKEIQPLKIRYEVSDERIVLKVDRILQKDKKTVMATMNNSKSNEYKYKCESIQGGIKKPFILTFNDQSCRWYMYI